MNIRIGSFGIITNDKNEILLIKRINTEYYELIGGKVEFLETVEHAFIREVKEETDIEIEIIETMPYDQYINKQKNEHWIGFTFHGKAICGEAKVLEPQKHEDVRWFRLEEIPENISTHAREAINALKLNI